MRPECEDGQWFQLERGQVGRPVQGKASDCMGLTEQEAALLVFWGGLPLEGNVYSVL